MEPACILVRALGSKVNDKKVGVHVGTLLGDLALSIKTREQAHSLYKIVCEQCESSKIVAAKGAYFSAFKAIIASNPPIQLPLLPLSFMMRCALAEIDNAKAGAAVKKAAEELVGVVVFHVGVAQLLGLGSEVRT